MVEHLSEPLLKAMRINGLPERYEHFEMQESFNPAGSFVEFRKRLMNYEENRIHREYVNDVDCGFTCGDDVQETKPKHKSSSRFNAPPKSSSGKLTCYWCDVKAHMKSECYQRKKSECTFCKQHGHLVQPCMKKATGTKPRSSTSSLKSGRASSEATEKDLVCRLMKYRPHSSEQKLVQKCKKK